MQEGTHGDKQAVGRPWWMGGRRMVTLEQDVFDGLSLLLNCRELLAKALDSVGEQASQADVSVRKADFVNISHFCQVKPVMTLLDHQGRHHSMSMIHPRMRLQHAPCPNTEDNREQPLCNSKMKWFVY